MRLNKEKFKTKMQISEVNEEEEKKQIGEEEEKTGKRKMVEQDNQS